MANTFPASGNAGIGETSPAYDLVIANTGNSILQIRAGDTSWSSLYFGETSTAYRGIIQYNHNDDYMAVYTTGTEKMRILTDGKVGIGTTAPAATLEVQGSASPSEIRVGGNIAHVAKMILETNTHYQDLELIISRYGYSFEQIKQLQYGGTSGGDPGGLHFQSNNGDDPHHFSVYQDKMYVGGDSDTPTFTYNLEVEGTFYSSGSSIDYKQEVQDYKPNTDAIMNLRPVHYEYKNKWKKFGKRLANNNGQIGLVAEEVAEVMPELAVMKEEDGKNVVRNVDYEKLTVVLLSAVQELEERITELESS